MLRPSIYRSAPVIFVPKPDARPKISKRPSAVLPKIPPIAKPPKKLVNSEAEFCKPARVSFCSNRDYLSADKITPTPSFEETNPREHLKLLAIKCQVCSNICDFTTKNNDVEQKAIKLATLNEIIRFILDPDSAKKLTSESMMVLFSMIRNNICRRFPHLTLLAKSDIPIDNEWEHIERVYKIVLVMMESKEVRLGCLQAQVNENFINLMFKNITALDPREQRMCCMILCRTVDKFFGARKLIVKKTNAFLRKCLYDAEFERCLPCFLSFYVEIVEYVKPSTSANFLTRVILPFLNCDVLPEYQSTFAELLQFFCEQDPRLVSTFLRYVLSHWPVRNVRKQSAMLEIVRQMLCEYARYASKDTIVMMLVKISDLFQDMAEDLSQHAIFVMSDEKILCAMGRNGKEAVKMVYSNALKASVGHWAVETREKACALMNKMKSDFLAPEECDECNTSENREQMWKIVGVLAGAT